MKLPLVAHHSVLITGCSSGIGRATARILRERGWRVLATARKPDDVAALAAEGFESFALDLADAASVANGASEALLRTGGTLGALVNNAGYGQPGAVEDVSRDALRAQFEANVLGLQDLTNRLLPAMITAGSGRIVHLSSVLGRVVIPMMGAYCATKHAVEALADVQRVELRGTGVGVMLVEPGPIETAFRRNAVSIGQATLQVNSRFSLPDLASRADGSGAFTKPPEAVAVKIVHALESRRPRARYPVTLPAYAAPLMHALLPQCVFDWIIGRRLPGKTEDGKLENGT
ncbi:MAG TPA: SDR family NAD(P)-dependent oxidoreductase [Kiritimatiellia bacterium]|nr:SDR family NAD(P)-dependent oxidoreductase [Kiritimatiellia bacterium]